MRQKGRKSTKFSVVDSFGVRPGVPDGLTEAERTMFLRILNEKPPDWFDAATVPLLVEYCRLQTQVDFLGSMLEKFTEEQLRASSEAARHRGFMQARDRSQKTMAMLATKMRLAQQSRYDPEKASGQVKKSGPSPPATMPWQTAS